MKKRFGRTVSVYERNGTAAPGSRFPAVVLLVIALLAVALLLIVH